jgi:hypothetical protein
MKNLLAIAALLVCSVGLCQGVDEAAKYEALRRGSHVEYVDGVQGEADMVAEVTAAPPNDSYKWTISVVTQANCQPCERLKYDFLNTPELKALVDKTHGTAAYGVFRIEDATQTWRLAGLNLTKFPAVVVQPPKNGMYGPDSDYLEPIVGYDGNGKKLAEKITSKMVARATAYKRANQRALVKGPEAGHDSPFLVLPEDKEGERPLSYQSERRTVGGLVDDLLSFTPLSFFPGNELILIVGGIAAAVVLVRNYRKKNGKTLLIDDATAAKIAETEKALIKSLAAKYGLTVGPSSPG